MNRILCSTFASCMAFCVPVWAQEVTVAPTVNSACNVQVRNYSGQGFGASGKVTGGYALNIKSIDGSKVQAIFSANRSTSGCGGEFPTAGVCRDKKLELKVKRTGVQGCSVDTTLILELQDGVLAGKYGLNVINNPGAPNNITLR